MACIKKNTVFCVSFLALYAMFCHVEAFNQCYFDFDCSYTMFCCARKYYEDKVCRFSCIWESCIYHSDCTSGESCCHSDNKCATTCIDKPCILDSNCASGESCCDSDNKCTTGNCDVTTKSLAGWIAAVIVVSVLVVIVVPITVVVFYCYFPAGAAAVSRRPAHGRGTETQPATIEIPLSSIQKQQQPSQQGQPMYYQPCLIQPPPYQPQATVYPPEASAPPIEMTTN